MSNTNESELEYLRAEVAGLTSTIIRQGDLLRRVVIAVRGDPPAGTGWSSHDAPELVVGAMAGHAAIRAAAEAVVARWDTPLWKDVPATAEFIGRLRDALAADGAERPAAKTASSRLDRLITRLQRQVKDLQGSRDHWMVRAMQAEGPKERRRPAGDPVVRRDVSLIDEGKTAGEPVAMGDLAAAQRPLPADMAAVLHKHAWDLYVTDDATSVAAQPAGEPCWLCSGIGVEFGDANEQSPCRVCADPPAAARVPAGDLSSDRAQLLDLLRELGCLGHAGAVAEIRKLRKEAALPAAARVPAGEPVQAERERCVAAIRSVQAAYDAKLGPGPSVEASVCSDCIGAIQATPPAAARVPLTVKRIHQAQNDAFLRATGGCGYYPDALAHEMQKACAEAWGITLIEASRQEGGAL